MHWGGIKQGGQAAAAGGALVQSGNQGFPTRSCRLAVQGAVGASSPNPITGAFRVQKDQCVQPPKKLSFVRRTQPRSIIGRNNRPGRRHDGYIAG